MFKIVGLLAHRPALCPNHVKTELNTLLSMAALFRHNRTPLAIDCFTDVEFLPAAFSGNAVVKMC